MPLFGPPDVDRMKTKRDIDGLIKALRHKDPDVRTQAARALGQIAQPSEGWLQRGLAGKMPYENVDESIYLGWIKGLIGALQDNELKVRQAAITALINICYYPDSKFGAAAIMAILALGDKTVEEQFIEMFVSNDDAPYLETNNGVHNLAKALNSPEGDLYVGQNSPLSPRTIAAIVSRLAATRYSRPRFVSLPDEESALRRVSHTAAIQPLFAIIADKRQLEQLTDMARDTIQKKLFFVSVLENVMRLNLTAIENDILEEISSFTLLEPTFRYFDIDTFDGRGNSLPLAGEEITGSRPIPTPGIHSLAQEELRCRAAA